MKKFFFSLSLFLFLLLCVTVYGSIQTYDAWISGTDIGKGGGDKTYTGSMKVKYWGSNSELGCQTYDANWSPTEPPREVAVEATVEYRGFGYISGAISSSHGVTSISGVSVGTFEKGPGGRAKQPLDTDPKSTYTFGTDPTDSPWLDMDRIGTCTEYASGTYYWSGTGAITIQGADWMSTSTTTTGSSQTETEGESQSETEGHSNTVGSEIGTEGGSMTSSMTDSESSTSGTHSSTSQTTSTSSSEGGSWDTAGAPQPISVTDGAGNWIISPVSTTSQYVCPQPYCFEVVSTRNEHRRVCGDLSAPSLPNTVKGCGEVYWVCPNSPDWYEVPQSIADLFLFSGLTAGSKVNEHRTIVICPMPYLKLGVIKDYCYFYHFLCNWGDCPHGMGGKKSGCSDCYDGNSHHHFD